LKRYFLFAHSIDFRSFKFNFISLQATIKEEASLSDRLELVGGSFFSSVPGGVDAYISTTVLHDWNDQKAGEILDVIHKSASPGAKLLLGETVVPEETCPAPSKIISGMTYPSILTHQLTPSLFQLT